jgi:spoIIIJ-associated protein
MFKLFQKKTNEKAEEIKEIVSNLLKIMGFEAKVEASEDGIGTIAINITCDEGGSLIGQGGVTLFSLQHIIRLLAVKKFGEETKNIGLDINNYRQGRTEILKGFILEKTSQVIREQKSFSFEPMTAYERRIAHVLLGERQDIVCQSEGEGEARHIVIRPA